jgi:hypothetical protein
MGLLEYQAMSSLRDVAHDGALCTFNKRSAPDLSRMVSLPLRAGGMDRPSRIKSHPAVPGHSPPAGQADRRVGPAH